VEACLIQSPEETLGFFYLFDSGEKKIGYGISILKEI
jgi:hypothetical protein